MDDRIDNNKGYSPDSCRFVTPKENSRNRRNTKFLTINGEKKCVAEWCEIIKVSPYIVYHWIRTKGAEYAEQRLSEIAYARSAVILETSLSTHDSGGLLAVTMMNVF